MLVPDDTSGADNRFAAVMYVRVCWNVDNMMEKELLPTKILRIRETAPEKNHKTRRSATNKRERINGFLSRRQIVQ